MLVAILTGPEGPVLLEDDQGGVEALLAVAILTGPEGPVLPLCVNDVGDDTLLRSSPAPKGRCCSSFMPP